MYEKKIGLDRTLPFWLLYTVESISELLDETSHIHIFMIILVNYE